MMDRLTDEMICRLTEGLMDETNEVNCLTDGLDALIQTIPRIAKSAVSKTQLMQ
jgi:hypothetical protein